MPERTVLIVTRNFPPLKGGMERLLSHIYRSCATEYKTCLVGPKGCGGWVSRGNTFREVSPSPLWQFLPQCWLATKRATQEIRPHLVIAGSGLTAFPASMSGTRSTRRIVYLHGLDIIASNLLYQAMLRAALKRTNTVLVNSRRTLQLAAAAGVPTGRIWVLNPGVECVDGDVAAMRGSVRTDGSAGPRLLSVGRLVHRKGLAEFVECGLPLIVRRKPKTILRIVGGEAGHAATRHANERRRIEKAAERVGLAKNIRFVGEISDHQLREEYLAADVHVFPVRDLPNDIEGFGMVALEAAAHGVPTVAFSAGGVPDAVFHGRSGMLVPPGDYEEFATKVNELLSDTNKMRWVQPCVSFARENSWEKFSTNLRRILALEMSETVLDQR